MNPVAPMGNNESLWREIWHYVRSEKRYWAIPLIIVFVVFGVLLVIAQTVPVVSPFIYTLF